MEMQDEKIPVFSSRYVACPIEIWNDEKLSPYDIVVFMQVDSLCDKEFGCFASNEYIAKGIRCSERQVSRSISKLKELGYIYQDSFDGRKRVIKTIRAEKIKQNSRLARQTSIIGEAD